MSFVAVVVVVVNKFDYYETDLILKELDTAAETDCYNHSSESNELAVSN